MIKHVYVIILVCISCIGCGKKFDLRYDYSVILIEDKDVLLNGMLNHPILYKDSVLFSKDFSSEYINSISLNSGKTIAANNDEIPWDSIYMHYYNQYKNEVKLSTNIFSINQLRFKNGLTCKDVTDFRLLDDTLYAGAYITYFTDSIINISQDGVNYTDTFLLSIPFIIKFAINNNKIFYHSYMNIDVPFAKLHDINLYSFVLCNDKLIALSNNRDSTLFYHFKLSSKKLIYTEPILSLSSVSNDQYFVPLVQSIKKCDFAYGNLLYFSNEIESIDISEILKKFKIPNGHIAAFNYEDSAIQLIYVDHTVDNKYYYLTGFIRSTDWKLNKVPLINPMCCTFTKRKLYTITSKGNNYEVLVYKVL